MTKQTNKEKPKTTKIKQRAKPNETNKKTW